MKLGKCSKIMTVTKANKEGTKMGVLIPDDMLRRIGCTPGDFIIITCDAEDEERLIVKRRRREDILRQLRRAALLLK